MTDIVYKNTVLWTDIESWKTAGKLAADSRWTAFLDSFAEHGADGFLFWTERFAPHFESTIGDLEQQGLSSELVDAFKSAHIEQMALHVGPWVAKLCDAPTA